MGKTFDENKYKSYTEFFAFNKTLGGDIDNLRDSDDGSPLLQKYNASKPPDGWFRRYWENGNLRYELYYKEGKQDGVSKSWWPNGDLKNERNYNNGILHGPLKGWWENGKVSGVRDFKNGNRHGEWTDWYENGQVWCKKTYDDGKLLSANYWNEDGSEGIEACHKRGELRYFQKINPKFH